jgi:hypothetical protein
MVVMGWWWWWYGGGSEWRRKRQCWRGGSGGGRLVVVVVLRVGLDLDTYVNDMARAKWELSFVLFADDKKVVAAGVRLSQAVLESKQGVRRAWQMVQV